MSIEIADLIGDVNGDLNRAESVAALSPTMEKALNRALRWLSRQGRWGCLHTSKLDYAVVAGDQYIAYPDNFRVLDQIVVNNGTYDSAPLERIDFEEWIKHREDESAGDYDEPEQFAERERRFYLEPRPEGAYAVKVWYWRWHPAIAAIGGTILFPEEYYDALIAAVDAAYLEGLKQLSVSQYWWARAQAEVADLFGDYDETEPGRVKYNDMG